MKHIPALAFLFFFLLSPGRAQDLYFAYEGDAAQRERLNEIQGTSTPPEWNLEKWANSEKLDLAGLKGKIVVLDFWATWCGPCIESIPHNNKIAQKYKDDVVLIGVCHPRGSENMDKVVKESKIEYPVAIDKKGRTADAYKVNGYPDYYLFDRSGTLVLADCSNSKVEQAIEKLLGR